MLSSCQFALQAAVVQTFATDATKRSGTLRGSCGENCIPNFGRDFAINAELSEFELTSPDPMYEFNTGDGSAQRNREIKDELASFEIAFDILVQKNAIAQFRRCCVA